MRRVVIVGAGIAGLATALRLTRDGWQALIVERAPARRSSGYLVNLLGPGFDAAERLGLVPALREHTLGLFTTVLVRADGTPKFTVPAAVAEAALGTRTLSVFRGDLETVLYQAVRDHAEIRFGTTVTAVDEQPGRVVVTLSDGTTEEADLLVAADGVNSKTRESGHRVDLPYVVAAFPIPGHEKTPATTFIGPGRTASTVRLGPGRSAAFFAYRCADPAAELAKGPAAALRATFGDLGGQAAEAIAGIGSEVYFDRVSQVRAPRWSTGRTVLLGDAAWCVTLFAGHGAGLAMAGADQLGASLQRHGDDIGAALREWEAALRPEVTKRQALARRGMAQYAPPTRFHVWMGDVMIRAITLPGIRTLVRRGIERQNR